MMSFNLILILIIFLILIQNYVIDGNDNFNLIKCPDEIPNLKKWSNYKSWKKLKLPIKGESINITTPILMDIKPPDLDVIRIFDKGMLVWKHINNLELRVKAILIYDGGQLIIGSEQCKFKYKATITLIGDSIYTEINQTINGNEYGQKVIGIDNGGTIELHSEVTKTTWTKLISTISPSTFNSNKNILTLLDNVNDWPIGSEILITSTDYDMEQSETNFIVKCSTCKTNQIKLKNPIKYLHWGSITKGVDERAEVALLTRNIKIQGQVGKTCVNNKLVCDFFPFDSFGAHIMIRKGFVNAHFFGIELFNVGQSHVVSRYPIHFHLCDRVDELGGYENPAYIKHCSVHKSFSRCYVVHSTDGLLIHDNIGFDSIGHCYMLCDGIEMDNVFSHNLGAVTRYGLLFPHDRSCDMCSRIQPNDFNGNPTQCTECNAVSTFWISNPWNTLIDNVASGSDSTGIWYLFSDYPSGLSHERGIKYNIKPYLIPVKKFYNNNVHSCTNGIQIDGGVKLTPPSKTQPQQLNSMINARYKPRSNPKNPNSKPSPSIFNGATIYKNKWRGCWARGGFLFMKNFKIADNAIGFTFASEGTIPGDQNVGQYIYKSLIVGESDNIGQQSNNIPIVNGRTNPYGENGLMPIRGFEIYDGTISLDSMVFSEFKSLPPLFRNSSAIGFLRFNDWQSSSETTIKNIKYINVDKEIHFEQSLMDGDKISTLRDLDGSTTKLSNSILVRNLLFYSTNNCYYKKPWDALICKEDTRQIYICNDDTNSTNYLSLSSSVVAIRDNIENQKIEQIGLPNHSPRNRFQFLVFKNHHYDFHFPNHPTPPILRVQPMNWKQSEKFTFGICIGISKGINLKVLKTVNGTYGNSNFVEELYPTFSMNLISESTYYFNEITSMLYIMYYQYNSKDHLNYCPEYGCEELVIKISGKNSGRVTGDCQSLAYGSSFTLFDEVVNRKFENSFQMDKSIIHNSEYAYRGNAYLPYHPTSKSQIQFKCNHCIPSVGIKYFEIWVNGNRNSNQRISIQLFYSINSNQLKSQPFAIDKNYFKKNSWVLVRILFENLKNLLPENHIHLISSFDGLSIINSLELNQPSLFLDNIKFIYDN
ncbi:hypothetical protein DDB_G0287365 [Dictyostelium discoideum AX4]|uniref:Protein DDB_G0287365 n=1 Tax=Dictyostelium discoideum TaxID=44689 RepID=Y7365_DICDI|nr:hypothetical protein DDB_G0287365 [Dictyostelium discoideum AX4]Q54KF6.1 RecName: Full=Protein DDB_G0287365; Flags: Precursor [Dictyostelium discoideum]EAL63750.1 hypothetical protein DDB_G0287365 [Dictyostelium discoideum AX4]|eukprot:XP_637267.1 hypothetical protein DDB_G0287365 [Dictyostelium discoideum AX4]